MKRANGEGTVYQRVDERWCAQVPVLTPEGRWKRKTVYGKTQAEVVAKRDEIRRAAAGRPVSTARQQTLAVYGRQWLEVTLVSRVAAGHLSRNTLDSYAAMWNGHIAPSLGHHRLDDLTPPVLRQWMSTKLTQQSRHGRPLSRRTLQYMHAVLRAALSDAVRDELIATNPAMLVKPPRGDGKKVEPLTRPQMEAFLAAAATHVRFPLWMLLFGTGMRVGEALALRWSNVDLDSAVVRVDGSVSRVRRLDRLGTEVIRKGPKRHGSEAVIALPSAVVAELRAHRARQVAHRLAARIWYEDDVVFASSVGTPLEQRNVLRELKAVAQQAGIERNLRVHDLRHEAASHMLAAGVQLVVVQQTLRHSRLATTADVYSHLLIEVKREAAEAMDARLTAYFRAGQPADAGA